MIIKVKALKKLDFNRLVRYILKDTGQKSFILRHNLRGRRMTDWIKEFENNEKKYRKKRRKNATIITHEIMSFAGSDLKNLSLKKIEDLAKKYIEYRGKNALILAVPHFDKQHVHVHFCISGIEYKSSKAMRMSKRQFQELKLNIQQYQMDTYPELTHSIVMHGRGSPNIVQDREYRVVKRKGESDRQKLKRLVDKAKNNSSSQQEFYKLLKEQGIETYERSGRVSGVIFNGRKYRWKTIEIENRQRNLMRGKGHDFFDL